MHGRCSAHLKSTYMLTVFLAATALAAPPGFAKGRDVVDGVPSLAACRALGFNVQEENDNDGGYRNNPAKLTAVPTAPSTVPGPTGVAPPPSPLVEESAADLSTTPMVAQRAQSGVLSGGLAYKQGQYLDETE